MKRLLVTLLVGAALVGCSSESTMENSTAEVDSTMENMNIYYDICHDLEAEMDGNIIDSSMLSADILENRVEHGWHIVEREICEVLDEDGHGKVLNSNDPYYNYVGFEPGMYKPGNIVAVYLEYADDNEVDTIISREEYLIDYKTYYFVSLQRSSGWVTSNKGMTPLENRIGKFKIHFGKFHSQWKI